MKTRPDFTLLYEIAEDQAGYFTTKQAHEANYSRERLSDLTSRGKFIRVRRGIYRLLHFPASRYEDLHIAQLATGPHSVISHESALAVYELSDILPTKTHIIIPRNGSRRRKGIQLHTNKLEKDEITSREGLPITTPARTIADAITWGVAYHLIEQAITEALRRGITSKNRLLIQADRRKGPVPKIINQVLKDMHP